MRTRELILFGLLLPIGGCLDTRGLLPNAHGNPARSAQLSPEDADLYWDERPFSLTYYWMATESAAAHKDTTLYQPSCEPIADVSEDFAARAALEGTGVLADGRIINTHGSCDCPHSPCFFTTASHQPWGVGVANKPLSPFRSVAVDPDMLDIGTRLYVPELAGLKMPGEAPWGGFVHDGCVTADDRGSGVRGRQIDFFTGRRSHYVRLKNMLSRMEVTVLPGYGRCGS